MVDGVNNIQAAQQSVPAAKAKAGEKPKKKGIPKLFDYALEKTTAKNGTGTKSRIWKSPKGTYPAVLDGHYTVKGLTYQQMIDSENCPKSQQRQSAAMYTMNTVLGTKLTGALSNESKAKLLAFIIKTNPSVFDQETGRLKDGADIARLDVPTKDKIVQLCGVKYNEKGEAIIQKDTNGAVINNFGLNARKDKDGKYHYYSPKGKEIPPEQFKAQSPKLYEQINS